MSLPSRALVLGGHGFLGSNLVRALVGSNIAVRVLDRRREPMVPAGGPVEFVEGDYTNRALTEEALEGVDVAIHLASSTTPSPNVGVPIHDVTENLLGSLGLVDSCVKRGIRRLVFASSGGTVYGSPRYVPIPEDHPQDPISSYGIVKLAVEKYLTMYGQAGSLDPTILRVANPYGPGQRLRGAQGAIAVAFGCILRGEPFHLWGDGGTVRDFFYIDDLTAAFLAVLRTPAAGPRVFNIGSGVGIAVRDVLAACERAAGRPLEIRRGPGRAVDVPANVLDCTRAQSQLGWSPRTTLEVGLARTWSWVASSGT